MRQVGGELSGCSPEIIQRLVGRILAEPGVMDPGGGIFFDEFARVAQEIVPWASNRSLHDEVVESIFGQYEREAVGMLGVIYVNANDSLDTP